MEHKRAFALREAVDPELFGGSVAMPDGSTFSIHDALVEHDGIIVTDDPNLIAALDVYPDLKNVGVPDESKELDKLTVDTLRELAASEQPPIELGDATKKQQIIDQIVAERQRRRDDANATDADEANASLDDNEGN